MATTGPTALQTRFDQLRQKGEKALVLFVTAGDPGLEQLPAILDALSEAGADVIEVGVPFTDPIADGPTIQASSQRALDRGVTPRQVLTMLGGQDFGAPIVLMGYYNTVLRRGLAEFAQAARDAGASGTIMCDLIPEEAADWVNASQTAGLDTVFLAAPTSTEERLEAVARASSGFVYAVSRTGVTGAASQAGADVDSLVTKLKAHTGLPVCVGFGISRPEHVASVCAVADGAVVGSWLVDKLAAEWDGGAGKSALQSAVRELKNATRG